MLMRHMHMGIIMNIAVRVCFITHAPFLRKLQKAYHAPYLLSTLFPVLALFFARPAAIADIFSVKVV